MSKYITLAHPVDGSAAGRIGASGRLATNSSPLRLSVLSGALAVAMLGLGSTDAQALALGPIQVRSAIGEPLRAEVIVTDITSTAEDAIKVKIGTPDDFKHAGMSWNQALVGVSVSVQKRADGRFVVQLAGDRPITDPFVDLLLEANWTDGRVVRDYTVLLNAPAGAAEETSLASAGKITAPQISTGAIARPTPSMPPVVANAPTVVASAPTKAATMPPIPRGQGDTKTARASASRSTPVQANGAAPGTETQVTVRPGDTATKIANATKAPEISLDQMLVALLRTNPDAFMRQNMNRLRSGAVLNVPGAEEAGSVPTAEARRMVVAQSRDFNDYRRKLAENAPTTNVAAADSKTIGRVQDSVEARSANAATGDKLKIATGAAGGDAAEAAARARQELDARARVAELAKNMKDIAEVQAGALGENSNSSATAVKSLGADAGAGNAPVAPVSIAMPGVNLPAVDVKSAEPDKTPVVVEDVTVAPRSLMDTVRENWLYVGGSALLVLLGAALALRRRARKGSLADDEDLEDNEPEDVRFEGTIQPAPVLAAAASVDRDVAAQASPELPAVASPAKDLRVARDPQQVAPVEAAAPLAPTPTPAPSFEFEIPSLRAPSESSGLAPTAKAPAVAETSSLVDGLPPVDAIQESGVYLEYGREKQAEEVIRNAMNKDPGRTDLTLCLLEIYAKRSDVLAFDLTARLLLQQTSGRGPDWASAVNMGRKLDSKNPLYQAPVDA